ncbi:hypothetical protein V6N13_114635 [Hibiscus sabdariffa]
MIKGESESEFKASWEKHRRPSCSLVLEGSCLEGSLLVAIRKMVLCLDQEGNKLPYEVHPPQTETKWLKLCLVGQLKSMYNVDLVRQALRSEEYSCQLCEWSGFYVLIHFDSGKGLEDFWKAKDSLLKSWFADLDQLHTFEQKKKQKVWITISSVPFSVWFDSFFKNLASLWGEVLKIDEETVAKTRFDVAHVLVGVSLTSDIPSSISIFVNGKISHIRVVVSEYEDERAWIVDESSTNSIEDESGRYSDDSQDEFNEEHLCDNNERNPQPFAEIPSPRGESNNVDVNSLSELGSDYANNANRVQIQTQNLYQPNISLGLPIDGVLLDVPVNQVQELSRNSSNHSDSVAPIFDRGSGLFTVKPKLLKKSRGENFIAYRSKFDRFQNWVVNSIPHGRTKGGFSSGKRQNRNLFLMENSSSLHSLGMLNSSPIISISGQKDSETDNQIEARNSVEVCSTLGLRTASDNFVAKRFSEITRENERST